MLKKEDFLDGANGDMLAFFWIIAVVTTNQAIHGFSAILGIDFVDTLLSASSKPTKLLKVNQRLVGAVLPDMSRVRYEYDLKPTKSPAVAGRGVNETHKRNCFAYDSRKDGFAPNGNASHPFGVELPFVSDVSNERIQDVMPKRIYQDNRLAWECQWRKDMAPQKLVDKIRNITYTWIYRKETDPLPVRLFIEGDIVKELGLASGTQTRSISI